MGIGSTGLYPVNPGLYELDGFGPWVRDRTLSVWLEMIPFSYELLVYIPTTGRILFNSIDYHRAARHLQLDLHGIGNNLADAEDIARCLCANHTTVWKQRLKPIFNENWFVVSRCLSVIPGITRLMTLKK